jgi:hypothetical protein
MNESTLTRLKILVERAIRPVQAGLVAVAAWLLVPVSSFALCLAFMADIQKSLWEVVPLLPYGVVAPVALAAVTYLVNSQFRDDREWTRLDIE